jgi:hypothetical protein
VDASEVIEDIPLAEGAGSLGYEIVSNPPRYSIEVIVGKEAFAGHTPRAKVKSS